MAQKSIITIGADAAGRCAGIYGQRNDYRTHIFDKIVHANGSRLVHRSTHFY